MARRAKPTRRTRIAPAKKRKAPKPKKAPPPLTPEQEQVRDAFVDAIDAGERSHWQLGDLVNHWTVNWKGTKQFRRFKSFYKAVIAPERADSAPSYSMLTMYGRVAAAWSSDVAIRFGMAKLALLYTWLTFKKLPFPQDPSAVEIPVPQDGRAVAKTFAEATAQELRAALSAAKKANRPSTPLTPRENWLVRRIDEGLEDYQPGGSVLLHASPGPTGLTFALSPSPAAHFIELIGCINEALHKDVPGDDEPNG
jgi:hypothetical protein